jgi:hypothetical protein
MPASHEHRARIGSRRTVLAFDPTNTGALDAVKRLGGG